MKKKKRAKKVVASWVPKAKHEKRVIKKLIKKGNSKRAKIRLIKLFSKANSPKLISIKSAEMEAENG